MKATALGSAVMLLAIGAAIAQAADDDQQQAGDSDAQFFMLLAYKPVASLNDAYQAVAMVVRGDGKVAPADECRKLLVERKIARESWGGDPATPLTKGKLAYMICQALGIKGGLTMRLFGPSERYCFFECQYLELMAGGAAYQHCAGGELVSVIDRADEYKRKQAEAAAGEAGKAEGASATAEGGAGDEASAAKAAAPAETSAARPAKDSDDKTASSSQQATAGDAETEKARDSKE